MVDEKLHSDKKSDKPVDKKHEKGKPSSHPGMPRVRGKEIEGVRLIVRIANKDLDGSLPIYRALEGIKGISNRLARTIAYAFESSTSIPYNTLLGRLTEENDRAIEQIITNPQGYGIPEWEMNRRKDFATGKTYHKVMADLDFTLREDIKRLNEIKSYRGLRHAWGLPVRGQRTKSTHRGKGGVVGVTKKDVKQAAAAAGKGEEKKEKK